MVEKGLTTKLKNDNPTLRIYKQSKISDTWLLSKTEDLPTSEIDQLETALSTQNFEVLVNQMETTEPLTLHPKRPFSNDEPQQSLKRVRSMNNEWVDEAENMVCGLGEKDDMMEGSSEYDLKIRRDTTDNKSIIIPIRDEKEHRTGNISVEKTVPDYQNLSRLYIDCAFRDIDAGISLQTMHEIFSYVCSHGGAQVLFTNISQALHDNTRIFCEKLESMASMNINFLAEMQLQLDHYQSILGNINSVCNDLNYYYICKETTSSSLLDFGLRIYTKMLTKSVKIKKRMISNIIYLMKCERTRKPVDNHITQSALKQLYQYIPAYIPYFENELISSITQFYSFQSCTAQPSMTIQNYIVFATKLILMEPILKQEYRKYLFKTAMSPADLVVKEVFLKDIDYIVQKGFKTLIESEQHIPLKTLYSFISPYDEIAVIHTAFGDYIKAECNKLCQNHRIVDPECHGRSPDRKNQSLAFVVSLLSLKSRMNSIIRTCFVNDDTGFQYTLKDSFEVAINHHQAQSAQHIACYIDDRLESLWPFSPSIDQSLDDGIGLLRCLQVEEVFKAHHSIYLGIRLLQSQQQNTIARCIDVTQRLKAEYGATFTKSMELMIKDVQRSTRQAQRFKDENRLASIEVKDRIDMNVRILTNKSWSLRSCSPKIELPHQLRKHQKIYHDFYQEEHPNCRLDWISALGTCTIEATYPTCTLELVTTEIDTLILLLFNNTHTESLSLEEICQQTGIDENRVKKSLKILSSQETPLLLKHQQPGASPEGDDSYNLFSYNTAFSSTRQVIEIQDISAELTSSSLKVMVHQELFTLKEKIQASLMKILKLHRRLPMNKIQQLVIVPNQMGHIDSPSESDDLITAELQNLVLRGFVAHELDTGAYVYIE